MKSLKKNKSRDPLGLVNEIFMLENAGEDLIQSLTLMMNKQSEDDSDYPATVQNEGCDTNIQKQRLPTRFR